MKITEIWRKIEEFDYEVSNLGRIRNLRTGRIRKYSKNNKGYYHVSLWNKQKRKDYLVHRLVARAFPEICGEWFEGCDINHKNCITTDCRAINLETCTTQYNVTYNGARQKCGKKLLNRSDESKPVTQYTLKGVLVATYSSIAEAARQMEIFKGNIWKCCKGIYKQTGGYIWKYA